MITYMEVDNFKSLVDFQLDLKGVTVLAGVNGAGKSSVLQAIDFAFTSAKRDFSEIIGNRGLRVENIKSKLKKTSKIRFLFELALMDAVGICHRIQWELTVWATSGDNGIRLYEERIVADEDEILLEMRDNKYSIQSDGKSSIVGQGVVMTSSMLKNLPNRNMIDKRLVLLDDYVNHFASFEILRTENMRLSKYQSFKEIGYDGRGLPSVIKRMSADQKDKFLAEVGMILGQSIKRVDTSQSNDGNVRIIITQDTGDREIIVTSQEISDGILRILAFLAITVSSEYDSLYLFDEIENGINQEYMEQIYLLFCTMFEEKKQQSVLVTHSTVFLDYVKPDQIMYIYKRNDGITKASKIFEVDDFKEKLEYMYPGEIFLNMHYDHDIRSIIEESV